MSTKLNTAEKPETLQTAIDRLFRDMANVGADSEEYAMMVTQMKTLYELKEVDHTIDSPKRVSRDVLVAAGANILGIVLIVGHERAHVVTSKALSLLQKIR